MSRSRRARTEPQVGLRPHVEAAFERTHVTVDFAGFSGETLNNTLGEVLDKVRAGRLSPESLAVRALVYDTTSPLVLPRRVDTDESDPAIQKRADRITRRSLGALADAVHELADLGLVKTATVAIRAHRLSPQFKLFILNNDEAFFAFYPIVEHTATVDGDTMQLYDVMGRDATLFHFSATDDETSNGPQYVDQARAWFDSVWTTVATEYQP